MNPQQQFSFGVKYLFTPYRNALYEVLDSPSAGFASSTLEISGIHSIFGKNCEPHCWTIASGWNVGYTGGYSALYGLLALPFELFRDSYSISLISGTRVSFFS